MTSTQSSTLFNLTFLSVQYHYCSKHMSTRMWENEKLINPTTFKKDKNNTDKLQKYIKLLSNIVTIT
jgi:hypothetical protein